MWKYYALKIAGFSLSYLPRELGYIGAVLIADFAYIFIPAARAGVADNMKRVLGPDIDDSALKKVVRGVLRNTAKNYFDLIKVPHMRLDEIERCMTVNGWQHLDDAIEKKRELF